MTHAQAPETATVLVVEDSLLNREALREFLEDAGYRVLEAADGVEGLEQVRLGKPDLVLLDIRMPRLDGLEACRRIKRNPATVFLPVVMITALEGLEDRIAAVEAGADDFLTKPFNSIELATRVRSLLRVKRLNDDLEVYRRDLEQRVIERTALLRRALDDLRELDRLKAEFVGRVSHELRTPLLHIKSYLDLLADAAMGPLTPSQTRGLDIATQATLQLERLVADIVDLGSAQVARLDLRPTPLPQVVEEALETVRQTATPHHVAIAAEVPETLPAVLADPQALTRCVRHLLDNAVKFSPERSAVEVRAEPADDGSHIRVSVRDHGVGIPPNQLGMVFQSFFQVDGSATRSYSGVGAGLALVKLLLEAQGSSIHVESEVGQGSVFYFELPVAAA